MLFSVGELLTVRMAVLSHTASICYSDDQVLGWRGGKGRLLVENYSSPLEERDVEISGPGQPFDFLGRYFCQDKRDNETLSYRLKRWENSIVSLVEPRIAGGSLDEEGIARCAQQIRSFRHENRFNPQALEKLELATFPCRMVPLSL